MTDEEAYIRAFREQLKTGWSFGCDVAFTTETGRVRSEPHAQSNRKPAEFTLTWCDQCGLYHVPGDHRNQ